MRQMRTASRRPGKPTEEPEGLDAFAGKASNVTVLMPPSKDDAERKWHQMNVRFTPEEHLTLKRLAEAQDRSMANVLRRLMAPVLQKAAEELPDP